MKIEPEIPEPMRTRVSSVADVAERLMAKYEPVLSLEVISATVRNVAALRRSGEAASRVRAEAILLAAERRLCSLAAPS